MKKAFAMVCAVMMVLSGSAMLSVSAEEKSILESVEEPVVTTVYLITDRLLIVANSNGRLYVDGITGCSTTMASIGIKDIVVERSSNGTSGWTAVAYPADYLKSNVSSCEMQKWITVSHGYYYRVTCNHYALETGAFPNSQTEPSTSNVVYIG